MQRGKLVRHSVATVAASDAFAVGVGVLLFVALGRGGSVVRGVLRIFWSILLLLVQQSATKNKQDTDTMC